MGPLAQRGYCIPLPGPPIPAGETRSRTESGYSGRRSTDEGRGARRSRVYWAFSDYPERAFVGKRSPYQT